MVAGTSRMGAGTSGYGRGLTAVSVWKLGVDVSVVRPAGTVDCIGELFCSGVSCVSETPLLGTALELGDTGTGTGVIWCGRLGSGAMIVSLYVWNWLWKEGSLEKGSKPRSLVSISHGRV